MTIITIGITTLLVSLLFYLWMQRSHPGKLPVSHILAIGCLMFIVANGVRVLLEAHLAGTFPGTHRYSTSIDETDSNHHSHGYSHRTTGTHGNIHSHGHSHSHDNGHSPHSHHDNE